ncbi:TPA: FMN-binding protein MioC [Aeromonas hydrophila]|nr:FMN-binding protein MioC [Aeromonas hydrophila]HAU4896035.1 FMN-binding protein MioC [Aeromonas hydrophila]HAU4975260.1 FMN-binding protein MioC [Aeromonas hydrophila]HAU4977489.1 FMN-binding protein MioC [Aeromonas hydrophila]HAU4984046.1 FMN-binding protein MioC [Aeromonas hydrophila]
MGKKHRGSIIPKLYPYLSTPFGGRIRLSLASSEIRIHSMAKLNLVVGSMLGAAEYVADHVASLLEQAGHQAEIHNPASLAEVLAEPEAILLVITSTHGAGDVPDNLQPFAKDLAEQHPDLKTLKYGVIALGDSSYDTFCQGGKTLDRLLAECGASRIGDRLDIDVTQHEIPEDAAEGWIRDWLALIA